MQHRYFDVSNLNAPYDNVPLMGLGQYGGGVFGRGMGSAGALGSLGALSASGNSVDAGSQGREWQSAMNAYLTAKGYNAISVDGMLGRSSCGAAEMICSDPAAASDSTISSFCAEIQGSCSEINHLKPWTRPSKVGAITTSTPSTSTPDGGTTPYVSYSRASGGATWWIVGGLVVAAGSIGIALYMRK